jgi:hypothetical protein
MKRLSRLTLVFAITFAILLISPALLSESFGPFPLMKTGDVTDLLTPLILIPLYWYLYRLGPDEPVSHKETVLFLVLVALWVEGQGMHLSANSIGHLLKGAEESSAYALTYFYDERLSHYLWHLGIAGLSIALLWRQWQTPFSGEPSSLRLEALAGLIYGLAFFIVTVEAQTAPLGVLFAVLVTLFGLTRGRKQLRYQPLLAFFFVASALAVMLFAYWAIRWGGLPEFSAVGIIE